MFRPNRGSRTWFCVLRVLVSVPGQSGLPEERLHAKQTQLRIRREGDHLVSERPGRSAQLLLPEAHDVFFTPGHPRTRRVFLRDGTER